LREEEVQAFLQLLEGEGEFEEPGRKIRLDVRPFVLVHVEE